MDTQLLSWAFQALILSAGIYAFLRFLRTSRGSGLMRGLVMTLLLGLVVLAGLAKVLGLLELEKLIESFTPSIAVILVILFQPELRRIISQVGKQNRLSRMLERNRAETVNEIVQGVAAMAGRRVGALIAIEREIALDEYTHNAVRLDAAVNRLTLESIFQPGGSLHDGAVVIRGDRIVAAACLFPLTDNAELSKSTGTRHRAALGLSDETDALAVVVSEETGGISVCRRGMIENGLTPQGLERFLREKLGLADGDGSKPKPAGPLLRFARSLHWLVTADVPRKLSALALGAVLIFIAHQEITQERQFSVQVRAVAGSSGEPDDDEFLIRLPSSEYHLVSPDDNKFLGVTVVGSSASIARLGGNLRGMLDVTGEMVGNPTDLDLDMIRGNWDGVLGLRMSWTNGAAPRLAVEQLERKQIALAGHHLDVDWRRLAPGFEVPLDQVEFSPDVITIKGPAGAEPALGSPEFPLEFETITLTPDDRATREYRIGLNKSLERLGYSIDGAATVEVTLPIVPVRREIGTIDLDIVISDLKPSGEDGRRWRLPARSETARFEIITRGVLPGDIEQGSPAWLERTSAVRKFVVENLRVFVDVSALSDGAGNEVEVEWMWRREWGSEDDAGPGAASEPGHLELRLESESRILLDEDDSRESAPGEGGDPREGN